MESDVHQHFKNVFPLKVSFTSGCSQVFNMKLRKPRKMEEPSSFVIPYSIFLGLLSQSVTLAQFLEPSQAHMSCGASPKPCVEKILSNCCLGSLVTPAASHHQDSVPLLRACYPAPASNVA